MKKQNPLRDKSYAFALKAIKLCYLIQHESKEYVLSKQFLKSATSIGANVEEAIGGQSEKDFLHKISIAYKEARETHYWLRLLIDSGIINKKENLSLISDVEELLRIIGSIQKTLKSKDKKT